jgi:hypothetical protein
LDFPAHVQTSVLGDFQTVDAARAVTVLGEQFPHHKTKVLKGDGSGATVGDDVVVHVSGPDGDSHAEGRRGRGITSIHRRSLLSTLAG